MSSRTRVEAKYGWTLLSKTRIGETTNYKVTLKCDFCEVLKEAYYSNWISKRLRCNCNHPSRPAKNLGISEAVYAEGVKKDKMTFLVSLQDHDMKAYYGTPEEVLAKLDLYKAQQIKNGKAFLFTGNSKQTVFRRESIDPLPRLLELLQEDLPEGVELTPPSNAYMSPPPGRYFVIAVDELKFFPQKREQLDNEGRPTGELIDWVDAVENPVWGGRYDKGNFPPHILAMYESIPGLYEGRGLGVAKCRDAGLKDADHLYLSYELLPEDENALLVREETARLKEAGLYVEPEKPKPVTNAAPLDFDSEDDFGSN